MTKKLLFNSQWIKVYENNHNFIFAERKGKNSVAVLCFRKNEKNQYEFLIHYQPLIALDEQNQSDSLTYPCLVTGSIEENEKDPLETALRELNEETGLEIHKEMKISPVKTYKYISSTQMNEIVTIFLFDVTNFNFSKPLTDGTYYEKISWNKWISFAEFKEMIFNYKNINLACLPISYMLFLELQSE